MRYSFLSHLECSRTGDHYGADALVRDTLATLRRTLGREHPIVTQVARGQRVEVYIEPPSA